MQPTSVVLTVVTGLLAFVCGTVLAQERCPDVGAVFESVEGLVEIDRGGDGNWSRVAVGDVICPGDRYRLSPTSRASLRLRDDTRIRFSPGTEGRWVPTEDRERSLWEVIIGEILIISRDPFKLGFRTPFTNAGLEGTEFVIAVTDEAAEITVIEGAVSMQNDMSTAMVVAGESGFAAAGFPIVVSDAEDYQKLLAWARDFSPPWSLLPIEADQEPAGPQVNDATFYADRAALRLNLGDSSAAEADLARAFELESTNAHALAIAELVLVDFPGSSIAALATQFRATNPDPLLGLLTEAVARQHRQDWKGARQSLEAAVEQDPDNAFAWAELAETRLALEDFPGAMDAASRAIDADAGVALGHTVFGFVYLANLDYSLAISSFEKSIALDQSAPLPHVGMGRVLTRRGDRDGGRQEFERAVVLDPADPVLRTYGARTYNDQRRESLASSQVGLAKSLDDAEPTAYLIDTLVKQSENRSVEALRDFEQATSLNGDQAIYRPTLLLDADPAVSNAGLGRVYGAVGYERLALVVGAASLQGASRDHSGHRLLADIYAAFPRYQIARVNELWQSQLLQPLSTTALPPQLAEPNLFILDSVGPAALSFNDLNPLLASNHWTIQGAGTYGGNDTRGEYLTVSGLMDRFSLSFGQYGFESVGFRENNDIESDVSNMSVQFRPNAVTSWIGEIRSTELTKGDLRLLFHDDKFNAFGRHQEGVDSIRLGMHRRFGENGDLIAALHRRDGTIAVQDGFGDVSGVFNGETLDVQHLYRLERWQLTSGVNSFGEDVRETSRSAQPIPDPPFVLEQVEMFESRAEFNSVYLYSDYLLAPAVTLTFGGSLDDLESRGSSRQEFNPKLGLAFSLNPRTTMRAAAFSTLQGPLISKENLQPRLEPTSVAGFNQFFFGSEGDEVTRYAIGLDQRLSSDLSYGLELSHRDIETGIFMFDFIQGPIEVRIETAEDSGRAYVYWTPDSSLALSAELQGDIFDNDGHVLADGYGKLTTLRLPIQVKYFHPNGLGAGIRATFADQAGDFGDADFGSGGLTPILTPDADQFWVIDANLTYRLRGRRGMLNLTMHNLFDEEFNFQDLDPENPRIMPDRLISFGFTLAL